MRQPQGELALANERFAIENNVEQQRQPETRRYLANGGGSETILT
jgi:hypothetical protein